jgi:hypothetical protein
VQSFLKKKTVEAIDIGSALVLHRMGLVTRKVQAGQ